MLRGIARLLHRRGRASAFGTLLRQSSRHSARCSSARHWLTERPEGTLELRYSTGQQLGERVEDATGIRRAARDEGIDLDLAVDREDALDERADDLVWDLRLGDRRG